MSKRKPTKASKRAHKPRVAAQAHRNKQDAVRSASHDLQSSATAGPTESPLELHDQEAPTIGNQKAPIPENRVAVIQGRTGQMRGFDFSSATANMLTSQAVLLEMAQANMRLAFEFSQELAMARSPFEFFDLIAKFARRRTEMFGKYTKEMAALTAPRRPHAERPNT